MTVSIIIVLIAATSLYKIFFIVMNKITQGSRNINDQWVGEVWVNIHGDFKNQYRRFYKSKKMAQFSVKYLAWKLRKDGKVRPNMELKCQVKESKDFPLNQKFITV